jgi:hypothetical protein
MSEKTLLDVLVARIKAELPPPRPEVSPEELLNNLLSSLMLSSEFKGLVKDVIDDKLEGVVDDAVSHYMRNSFSLSDYDTDLPGIIEQVMRERKFMNTLETLVTDTVESELRDAVSDVENSLERYVDTSFEENDTLAKAEAFFSELEKLQREAA